MVKFCRRSIGLLMLSALGGCFGGPDSFDAPTVSVSSAADGAMKLYDANGDGALDKDELAKCPGILGKLPAYDKNGDGKVGRDEIESHLAQLLKFGTGGTQLNALVTYKGRPLVGAEVLLEPEPYLGGEVQAAKGTTNGSGSTELGIPPEFLPSHLKRIQAVHYGTFKVRITHPSTAIPAKYNTETTLGYETEIGNPIVRFELK